MTHPDIEMHKALVLSTGHLPGPITKENAPDKDAQAEVIADLTTQLDAYKLIAGRLANTLDRAHYELPTGQDWSIIHPTPDLIEEPNDC